MNFYKHHLGDYAAGTAHLSWDEDCAYRRLLDAYYKREAPIPAELRDACRLARATTPGQKRAVQTVLSEFFKLEQDGWHQKRCDEELHAATAQADTNRRIASEREARKRERRAHEPLHESLHGLGNEPSTNRSPATMGEREPSQTPDSRHQTPDLPQAAAGVDPATPGHEHDPPLPPPLSKPVTERAVEISVLLRRAGAKLTGSDPRVLDWAKRGVSDAQLLTATDKAIEARHRKADAAPINAGFIDALLVDVIAERPTYDLDALAKATA